MNRLKSDRPTSFVDAHVRTKNYDSVFHSFGVTTRKFKDFKFTGVTELLQQRVKRKNIDESDIVRSSNLLVKLSVCVKIC